MGKDKAVKDVAAKAEKAKEQARKAKAAAQKAKDRAKKVEQQVERVQEDAARELKAARRQVTLLTRTVEKLESRIEKLDGKAARWKNEAREGRTQIAKLEAKLRRARRHAPVAPLPPAERGDLPLEDDVVELPADGSLDETDATPVAGTPVDVLTDDPAPVAEVGVEDEVVEARVDDPSLDPAPGVLAPAGPGVDPTWTVARLRAEARAQGVAGASRMTKAQLLAALGA